MGPPLFSVLSIGHWDKSSLIGKENLKTSEITETLSTMQVCDSLAIVSVAAGVAIRVGAAMRKWDFC